MTTCCLEGKRALITGGASPTGATLARLFAEEGAHVLVTGDALRDSDEFPQCGTTARAAIESVRADVGDVRGVRAVFDCVERVLGGVDIVVHNAVSPTPQKAEQLSPEALGRAFAANVSSAFLLTRAAVPHLRQDGGGVIVLAASTAGLVARSMVMLTRSLAVGLTADSIRVTALYPDVTDASMVAMSAQNSGSRALVTTRLGHFGTPDEVAECLLFLASDAGARITDRLPRSSHGMPATVNNGS